jgi:hypothetical protein
LRRRVAALSRYLARAQAQAAAAAAAQERGQP